MPRAGRVAAPPWCGESAREELEQRVVISCAGLTLKPWGAAPTTMGSLCAIAACMEAPELSYRTVASPGVYDGCEDRDVRPIIPLRNTTGVACGDHKPPTCERGEWTFAGADYAKATK